MTSQIEHVHVWENLEIVLNAQNPYENPYTEVGVWVDLTGPDFQKRCYGFWDGDNTFRVRILATAPGEWAWASGSNATDPGLNGNQGSFVAVDWTEEEKAENVCRRGFLRPRPTTMRSEVQTGHHFSCWAIHGGPHPLSASPGTMTMMSALLVRKWASKTCSAFANSKGSIALR